MTELSGFNICKELKLFKIKMTESKNCLVGRVVSHVANLLARAIAIQGGAVGVARLSSTC
jgi:hypothetical protein